jgi:hypothetical protein
MEPTAREENANWVVGLDLNEGAQDGRVDIVGSKDSCTVETVLHAAAKRG